MGPVLLLLLLAALNSESTANLPEDNTGRKFIVAFPENIAYYYPDLPKNKIIVTALYDSTKVTIKQHTFDTGDKLMNAGESKQFILDTKMELMRQNITSKTLVLTSDKNITVQAVSLRGKSMQTALVLPVDKMGKEYLIPPIPSITGTTDQVLMNVPERSPFKLLIISGDQRTQVTIKGAKDRDFSLQPEQVAQIWIQEEDELRAVRANQPVAVLFAHSCANQYNCTCGLLYNVLPPAREEKVKFFIPPVLATDAQGETFLLLSEKDSKKIKPFDSNSPLVETAGTVLLYRPGLLLPLIPETDFAACFTVSHISDTQSFAVIMVHKDFTAGVRYGNQPLVKPQWTRLEKTEYSWTKVQLVQNENILWHTSSTMAVYFTGTMEGALFGNLAAVISKTPDFEGCALIPEVVTIGEVAGGWRESLKYCKDKNLDLVSLSNGQHRTQIYQRVIQANSHSKREVWIGMRRSSETGEWYWINNDPVSDTNWGEGEPGTVHDGQCAILNLESGKDFGWRDEDCCKAASPVCYKDSVILKGRGTTVE